MSEFSFNLTLNNQQCWINYQLTSVCISPEFSMYFTCSLLHILKVSIGTGMANYSLSCKFCDMWHKFILVPI